MILCMRHTFENLIPELCRVSFFVGAVYRLAFRILFWGDTDGAFCVCLLHGWLGAAAVFMALKLSVCLIEIIILTLALLSLMSFLSVSDKNSLDDIRNVANVPILFRNINTLINLLI